MKFVDNLHCCNPAVVSECNFTSIVCVLLLLVKAQLLPLLEGPCGTKNTPFTVAFAIASGFGQCPGLGLWKNLSLSSGNTLGNEYRTLNLDHPYSERLDMSSIHELILSSLLNNLAIRTMALLCHMLEKSN
ncbi:hypothetical protein DPMN_152417 [Dreissena polymorpha]|uniref:Uncharacterized protein n=1 Tax=Dreissena polymorpha TaxID=45954 RepID=A0A9D4J7C1_DREPO|nr:hypothetical protein DPMN_152417 [Dreissena polymorpha]